jgi:hypothetical protein
MAGIIAAHEIGHNLGINHNEMGFPPNKGPVGGTDQCTAQANVMDGKAVMNERMRMIHGYYWHL